MTDYKQLAERLRAIPTSEPEQYYDIEAVIALCEAAAGGADEQQRCERVALEFVRSLSTTPPSRIADTFVRERAAARAEAAAADTVSRLVYEQAVKGRQDFRAAYREALESMQALQAKHQALRAAAKALFAQRDMDCDSLDFDPLYDALERS